MFCHHCGSQIADDARACIHCGTFTRAAAAAAPPPPGNAPRAAAAGMRYCHHCGSQIPLAALLCVHCGVGVPGAQDPLERALLPQEGHSWLVALLLALFGGYLGLHRFYVGKVVTGLLLFFTIGGFGVIWMIDLIRIVLGGFTDADGRRLVR